MASLEEKKLLEKLALGSLDGMVGDEREYREYHSVYCGKIIQGGIPISYRQEKPTGEYEAGRDERLEEVFDTEEQKLEFLRRYGWLMEDPDVRAYSARYKSNRHDKNRN